MSPPKRSFLSVNRIFKAFSYSADGLKHATRNEPAFQQELILIALLTGACIVLPLGALLKIALLIAHALILIVELLNSAVEALANKVCTDRDELIKQTKDMASAAVLLSFVPAALLWGYALLTLL